VQLKDQVHRWAQAELAPLAESVDRDNAFPEGMWKKLGDLGVLGVTASPDYGGLGLGYLDHAYVMEEISRASGSVGLSYGAHSNLCVNQIHRNGTPEQRERYLPNLISGDWVGSLAMSETGSGSDVMSMRLEAKRVDGGYVLNGAKFWITNAPDAHVIVVYARTSAKRITAFIVDTAESPVWRGPKLDKLGMRGSNTCELRFEDCFVPEANVLGEVDGGAQVLMSGLDLERLVLSGGPVGLSQAALDIALPYTHEREQFGRPVATFELVQGQLADMYAELTASRSYLYAVGKAADAGSTGPALRQSCAALILYTAERATRHGMQAIQLLGGNGYTNEYPAARVMVTNNWSWCAGCSWLSGCSLFFCFVLFSSVMPSCMRLVRVRVKCVATSWVESSTNSLASTPRHKKQNPT
jgi:isovaleryl-CoA dehydrogenase